VPVGEQLSVCRRALELPGVVGVRSLAAGEDNVVVTVVAADDDELGRIASALSDLGARVSREELVRRDSTAPFSGFRDAAADPQP
jgi:hypothetical protein